jgi:hypothetical protein
MFMTFGGGRFSGWAESGTRCGKLLFVTGRATPSSSILASTLVSMIRAPGSFARAWRCRRRSRRVVRVTTPFLSTFLTDGASSGLPTGAKSTRAHVPSGASWYGTLALKAMAPGLTAGTLGAGVGLAGL